MKTKLSFLTATLLILMSVSSVYGGMGMIITPPEPSSNSLITFTVRTGMPNTEFVFSLLNTTSSQGCTPALKTITPLLKLTVTSDRATGSFKVALNNTLAVGEYAMLVKAPSGLYNCWTMYVSPT